MNVAIVVGLSWHSKELAAGIRNLGHTVTIISTSAVASEGFRIPMNFLVKLSERFHFLKILVNPIFSFFARRITNRLHFDLVYIWSSYGFKFKDSSTFKIVIRGSSHIRTQYSLLDKESNLSDVVSIYLEERDYRLADRISVPTEMIASDKNWDRYRKKMNISPYGCHPPNPTIFTSMKTPRFRAIFIGEFGYRKGADRLLEFLNAPGLVDSFTILGKNNSGIKNLPKWWEYVGQVPHEKVEQYLRDSDVLILLSREEGMARVGLEAISVGVPIIVSIETGLEFWIEKGCGVMLEDANSKMQFQNALQEIRINKKTYINNCFSAADSWSWADHAQRTLSGLQHFEKRL